MEINFAVLARNYDTKVEDEIDLQGVFWFLTARKFPFQIPPFYVVTNLTTDAYDAGKEFEISIYSGTEFSAAQHLFTSITFVAPDVAQAGFANANVCASIDEGTIPEPGVYYFDILIEGELQKRVRLVVQEDID